MAEVGNTKKTFFSGVLLLTLSTVLVKLIGLLCKIPMLSYLGSEGMGYFNSAYEIYALFCVISTAGLPVALSVLISATLAKGEGARVRKIWRMSLTVFLSVGLLGSAVMLLFARRFCQMIQSEGAYLSILSIAPTVLLICIASALRGYFQGYQKMLPTALSQIIEALGKLIFGLFLARFALRMGYDTPTVAAFAGVGLSLGSLCSMLYLIVEKLRFHPAEEQEPIIQADSVHDPREILRRLGALAVPMTLGASLVSMTKLIDMTMILRRLQSIGLSAVAANEAYGGYTTLALSVYGLLPALVNGVALPLVPMLSAAIASGERERQQSLIRASYRLTSLFAIPASLGVAAFARPILLLLFGNEPEAVELAAPLLSYLGVSVFLSCMITASNSVLHAYCAVNRPILSLVAGALVKIVSAYFLIGNAHIGLVGAPISTLLCNAAVVLMNLYFAERLQPVKGLMSVFLRPLFAATLSVGGAYAAYAALISHFGEHTLFTGVTILTASLLYLILGCRFGVLEEEDLISMPCGAALCRILCKLRLLHRERPNG